MCGIVGYIGDKPVYDILINGLKKLEYRGYDSSGLMIYDDKLLIRKSKGKFIKRVNK
jgi:glucosamine--fructose-6-phosphate aminotransferase (isomerizing)